MDNKVNETQESFEEAAAVERPASSEVKVDSKELAEFIVGVLSDRKATDIRLLRVAEKTVLTDYFVICTGNSNTQIKGIAGEIDAKVAEKYGLTPRSTEGYADANWILIDYGCAIVHIFNREKRGFYNLEKLYADAKEIDIGNLIETDEEPEAESDAAAPDSEE
ncbi:MAG TPA: ribosome silencing factor [Clostridiales bacterium]|jgi:ribosome-associated protein|nr:ribosome silencing factor [Clostridiales bacterium]